MGESLVTRGGDDDALARRKSIVLHHVGCAELVERRRNVTDRRAHPRHRGGNTGLGHHLLGERLAALELRRLGRGAKARDATGTHRIGGSRHQGHLGTDDDQACLERHRERPDRLGIGDVHRHGLDDRGDSGIARRCHDRRHRLIGQQPGDDGVLTGSSADDENLHDASLGAERSASAQGQ